jgi:large subunit ribosomal protein L25
MAENELQVAPRGVIGKKVAALRREGQTPANVFGHHIDSTAVQASTPELIHLLRSMGRNALITLNIAGESAPRTVMVRDIARNPLDGKMLHVDFYQVNMTEKMRADVPVILTGTSDAVVTYGGVLMQMVDVIHVEALPADIPSEYVVDVGQLTQLEQAVHVRDLHIEGGIVTILSDPDIVLARVAAPRLVVEEEAAAAPVEEGAEPAEGGEAAAEATE